jgi:isoleucyl-tRNA synthetase
MQFVDEDLSKWYVRLSRARFYEVEGADHQAAFATLHEVLLVTARLLAPFTPFLADALHRALDAGSVHLAPYARGAAAAAQVDAGLEEAMDGIRALARLGHAARDEAGVKVRQPLPALQCVVPGDPAPVAALAPLLAAELNVKQVEFVTSTDALVALEGKANFRTLGKAFGKETPRVAEAVGGLSRDLLQRLAAGEAVTMSVDGVPRLIAPEHVAIIRRASGAAVVQEDAGFGVALDPTVTPALRQEGWAREVVSRLQRLRKEAGLAVSDRIRVRVEAEAEVAEAVAAHRGWIADEVLAVGLDVGVLAPMAVAAPDGTWTASQVADVDGQAVHLALSKDGV